MNKITCIVIALLICSHSLKAQTTIYTFTNPNAPKVNGSASQAATKRPLPIWLEFDSTFSPGQTISVVSDTTASGTLILKDTINSEVIQPFGIFKLSKFYYATFNKDSTLAGTPHQGSGKLTGSKFYVVIGSHKFGPFNFRDPISNAGYKSGSLFYDALKLKQLYNATDDSSKSLELKILGDYGIGSPTTLGNNIFLDSLYKKLIQVGEIFGPAQINLTSTASAASGASITTTIAAGIADFLIKRFKQELSQAFFEHFKDDMNKPQFADLKVLFPETWKTLQTIDNGIFQFSVYLNTLQQSFIKDLTNGYTDLQNLLNQQKYKDYFYNKRPILGSILYTTFYIVNGIKSKKHPGTVLEGYNSDVNLKLCIKCDPSQDTVNTQTNVRSAIKTLQLLSFSVKSLSSTSYWVTADSVKNLLENDTSLKIYLGLVGQVAANRKINFSIKQNGARPPYKSVPLLDYFDTLASYNVVDSIFAYKYFIETMVEKTDAVESSIAAIKSSKSADSTYNEYYKLFSSTLDLLDSARGVFNLPYIKLPDDQKNDVDRDANALLYVARSGAELYVDVNTKNYSSAIENVVSILDTLLDFNAAFKLSELKNVASQSLAALTGEWRNVSVDDSTALQKIDNTYIGSPNMSLASIRYSGADSATIVPLAVKYIADQRAYNLAANHKDLRQYILKYGSFIAAMASAKSPDDAEAAIESVALPVGSYTIKQKSDFNLSINGYVGYAFDFNGGMSSGIYAPIGIAASKGIGPKKKGGAVTLFFGVLDVGGIVAYRSQNSNTTTLKQDVRLESILSPSAQVMYEIPTWPIAVCAGWRLTPRLVYSSSGGDFYVQQPSNVLNLSILVDIPFFTLVNNAK